MQFDHIGIFVRSLGQGREHLSKLLNVGDWSEEVHDEILKISLQYGWDKSGQRYELVAPRGEGNPICGSLARKSNLLNHVAYRVPDLAAAINHWQKAGAKRLGPPEPAKAYNGAQVMFFMSPLGFIVELIEGLSET